MHLQERQRQIAAEKARMAFLEERNRTQREAEQQEKWVVQGLLGVGGALQMC